MSVILPNLISQEETKEESPIIQQLDRKIKFVQSFHDSYEVSLKEFKAAIETFKLSS